MKNKILIIHRWLGIVFGIFIFILCLTGAILLLSPGGHPGPDFFEAVKKLHRWLFLVPANPHGGMSVGRFIMGASAIAMTLIVITGIYLWWPKSKVMLKNRLKVSTNKGLRRFIYDCHVSLGIYAAVFLLLMSLTGPSWSFGWYNKATMAMLGGETEMMAPQAGPGHDKAPEQAMRAQKHDFHHDMKNGKKPAQMVVMEVHTGKWAGWLSKVIYLLAALIGASLPVTGYYMWWKRTHRKVPARE